MDGDAVVIRDDFGRQATRQRLEDLPDEDLRQMAVRGDDQAALIWVRRQREALGDNG